MKRYAAVLSLPGAWEFSASATLVRLGQAMLGLGSVLLLVQTGRSYAVAGLVAGAISIAQGVLGPQVARLVDERGQRAVVLPQVIVHALCLAGLITASTAGASAWVLFVVGLLVGASLPQAGALARARWTELLGQRAELDHALALESLIEEAVFVLGPVLVTFLATAVAPQAGLLAALGLVVTGTAAFLSRRRTEPVPRSTVVSTSTGGATSDDRPSAGDAANPPDAANPANPARGALPVLVSTFVAIGLLFGLIEVGVVALSREQDAARAAGLMLGLWAAGSLAAGVLYGARTWRQDAVVRLRFSALAMAVGVVLVALASATGSLAATTVALVVAGLANAPTLITGNTLVPVVVPARRLTEAYTWLGVAVFAGIAVGSAVGGTLIDHHGPGAALWAAVAAGALVAAVPWSPALRSTPRDTRRLDELGGVQ